MWNMTMLENTRRPSKAHAPWRAHKGSLFPKKNTNTSNYRKYWYLHFCPPFHPGTQRFSGKKGARKGILEGRTIIKAWSYEKKIVRNYRKGKVERVFFSSEDWSYLGILYEEFLCIYIAPTNCYRKTRFNGLSLDYSKLSNTAKAKTLWKRDIEWIKDSFQTISLLR